MLADYSRLILIRILYDPLQKDIYPLHQNIFKTHALVLQTATPTQTSGHLRQDFCFLRQKYIYHGALGQPSSSPFPQALQKGIVQGGSPFGKGDRDLLLDFDVSGHIGNSLLVNVQRNPFSSQRRTKTTEEIDLP